MLTYIKQYVHRARHPERYRLLQVLLNNQKLSTDQLILKQQQELSTIIRHAYNNSSYYHSKYSDGLNAEVLPILNKQEVVNHMEEILSRNVDKRFVSIGSTSGSTGKPLSFYYDHHKHELMRAGMYRSYMGSGWRPGQKILNFWGATQDIKQRNNITRKFHAYIAAEQTIDAHEYNEEQLRSWSHYIQRYKPVLLQGYASILAELSRYIIAHNIPIPKTILGVFTTAEVLYDGQRKLIENAFCCKVFNQYGSREIPNIACECKYGNHHVFTDMVYLESIVHNLENRLVVTSLTDKIMPFIRYDIGDSGKLKEGKCECGSPFPMMEMGLCRRNDLIKTPNGKNIHPSYFNSLLYGMTEIQHYQYVQDAPELITLNVVSTIPISAEKVSAIREKILKDIDNNMKIKIHQVDEIKRSRSGKHRFVINNWSSTNDQ